VSGLPIKAKPLKDGGAKSERLKPTQVILVRTDRLPKGKPGETRRRKVMGLPPQFVLRARLPDCRRANLLAGMTVIQSSLLLLSIMSAGYNRGLEKDTLTRNEPYLSKVFVFISARVFSFLFPAF